MAIKYIDRNMNFAWLEFEAGEEILLPGTRYARISVPESVESNIEYFADGYLLADRTLEVKIALQNKEFQNVKRLEIIKSAEYKREIQELALSGFEQDNRFRITFDGSWKEKYEYIISKWIDEMEEAYVCIYKDFVIGFMQITETEQKQPFIKLAATDSKYRLTGVGTAMYQYAANEYKKRGYPSLYGRISTRNTAVMNIYASMGGQFADPWDIYIKR